MTPTQREAALRLAMHKAFGLGQTYCQQADSESYSQNAKAEVTAAKFAELVDETCAALLRELVAATDAENATVERARYATQIMELEKALGECTGALQTAGHPIEWQRKIDRAVIDERERCASLLETSPMSGGITRALAHQIRAHGIGEAL